MGGRGSSSGSRKSRNSVSTLIDNPEKDSKMLFTNAEGKYTETREKVHKRIIKNTLKRTDVAREGEKPVAVIVAGGSGTGKSNLRNRHVLNQLEKSGYKRMAVIDNDLVKMQLPEYKRMLDKGYNKASTKVHREAGDIARATLVKAVSERRHFVLDTTMSNDKYTLNMIKGLKKRGYDVEIHFTTSSTEVALQRVNRRNLKGRYVPPQVVVDSNRKAKTTFNIVQKYADRVTVYDTSGKLPTVTHNVVRNPLGPRVKPVKVPKSGSPVKPVRPPKPPKPPKVYTPRTTKPKSPSKNKKPPKDSKPKNKGNISSMSMNEFIDSLFD